jgi:GTP-binding GTPase N-terminal
MRLFATSTDTQEPPLAAPLANASATINTYAQPAPAQIINYDEDEEAIRFRPTSARADDFIQMRELDQILTERASRFYDPALVGVQKEKCLLVSVEVKLESRRMLNRKTAAIEFSHLESLSELSELVGTAGLQVMGSVVQKLSSPNVKTYVGPGKVPDIMALVNSTGTTTLVIDDDLSTKQQRNLEDAFAANGGSNIKILDRCRLLYSSYCITALIGIVL